MISSFIQALCFIDVSEQEKNRRRIYDLPNAETKPKYFYPLYTKQRNIIYPKNVFKGKREWKIKQKMKLRIFTAFATTIKKTLQRQ